MKDCKSIFLSVFVLSLCFTQGLSAQYTNAQEQQRKGKVFIGQPVDSSRYEMLYVLTAKDPVINQEEFEVRIMQVGDSAIFDDMYSSFRRDSVFRNIAGEALGRDEFIYMTMGDAMSIYMGYGKVPGRTHGDTFLFDNGKWREYSLLAHRHQCCYDSTAVQDWELTDDTQTILGIECKKAKCKFRGREWTAWYAPEIPFSVGPWKLRGLPGLILKAEDASGEYTMEAGLLRPGSGVIVRNMNMAPVLTRQQYADLYRKDHEYPLRDSAYNLPDGSPNPNADERRFYNPIEKTLD